MRITFGTAYRNGLDALARTAADLASKQAVVSSGRRINAPSDDPSGTAASIRERTEAAALDRYIGATDSTTSRLTVADSVLSDLVLQLSNAQVAGMSGRGSSATSAQREAAAERVESIREAVIADFNASFNGTYLFAGTAATTMPFAVQPDGTLAPYAGNDGSMAVDVDRQVDVRIAFDGGALASGGGRDVFAILDDLAASLRAGDEDATSAAMDAVKSAMDRVQALQSQVGGDLGLLETERARLSQLKLGATARISAHEDADMAAALSDLSRADTAYRAALGAVGTLQQPSLLDFLR